VHKSENVGMSSKKLGGNPSRRKSKVSWAMTVNPGLVGPKARLRSVVDGQQVNIPALSLISNGRTWSLSFGRDSVTLVAD
jgi:hypothetical protein